MKGEVFVSNDVVDVQKRGVGVRVGGVSAEGVERKVNSTSWHLFLIPPFILYRLSSLRFLLSITSNFMSSWEREKKRGGKTDQSTSSHFQYLSKTKLQHENQLICSTWLIDWYSYPLCMHNILNVTVPYRTVCLTPLCKGPKLLQFSPENRFEKLVDEFFYNGHGKQWKKSKKN